MPTTSINLPTALDHFAQHDPRMHQLLSDALNAKHPIAVPQEKSADEYFASIVASIISQQISTKAADAVRARVVDYLGGSITPESVAQADFDGLKGCGLSNQKTKYIKHNAQIWHELPTDQFPQMSDAEIIRHLTALYGIGRWTAEMFLIFSMARGDVFSYGDLGLMQALYDSYGYHPHYSRKIRRTVDTWSPHRTAAALALWYTKDNGPVLL